MNQTEESRASYDFIINCTSKKNNHCVEHSNSNNNVSADILETDSLQVVAAAVITTIVLPVLSTLK